MSHLPSIHSSVLHLPRLLILSLSPCHLPPLCYSCCHPSFIFSRPTLSPPRSVSQLPPPASSHHGEHPAEGGKGLSCSREQRNTPQEQRSSEASWEKPSQFLPSSVAPCVLLCLLHPSSTLFSSFYLHLLPFRDFSVLTVFL